MPTPRHHKLRAGDPAECSRKEPAMFNVATVTREFGGGGSLIAHRAHRVAEILGWRLWDGALVEAVARATQVDPETVGRCDEHVDSWWHRFHRSGLRAAAILAGMPPSEAQFSDGETVAAAAQQVISRAAAAGNCVIVGRGAQCVLQDREDAYHVFVYAPWRERVSRVRGRFRAVPDVGELIRQTDEERARYIRTYYDCDWKDPHLYHMMICSQVGIENAACMIVEAVLRGR
jgi:cytidylate kinase-like protein